MASLRTCITEITTGLGTLSAASLDEALAPPRPPSELRNVDGDTWQALRDARAARTHDPEFLAAWNNGRALLRASEGLRGRPPLLVEWKGPHRDPAEGAVPADLRIDHVYLVSCKYLSSVLHNASPWALFDHCLRGGRDARGPGNWFDEVAPAEHQRLYQEVRRSVDSPERLPERVGDLSRDQQRALSDAPGWGTTEVTDAYAELIAAVAAHSARRWSHALSTDRQRRAMLWDLLRLSPTPYFVLGTGRGTSLRLRVATPWDWQQEHRLRSFEVAPEPGGQPRVAWSAEVEDRSGPTSRTVRGHVEVRWSHGRLGGQPEAKVYLDTPHREVPGYVPVS